MSPFRIAFALIRIPQLFLFLFLFPLLGGLLIVLMQNIATGVILKSTNATTDEIREAQAKIRDGGLAKRLFLGNAKFESITVCRWAPDASGIEHPPAVGCAPETLDPAIQVVNPQTADVEAYRKMFQGNAARLHVCSSCQPDLVIKKNIDGTSSTELRSIFGGVLLYFATLNEDIQEQFIEARKKKDSFIGDLGDISLSLKGVPTPIRLSDIYEILVGTINLAGLLVLALWLAVKAHRKVLDYFARSGALQPMAAAFRPSSFYRALWLLTGFRTLAFCGLAIPFTINQFRQFTGHSIFETLFPGSFATAMIWVVAMFCGLTLAALVSSIADLRHRHQALSFLYRYIPAFIAFVAAVVWAFSFLFVSDFAVTLRNILCALPLTGMVPILIAPAIGVPTSILIIHGVTTALFCLFVLSHNERWWAAHLDEL